MSWVMSEKWIMTVWSHSCPGLAKASVGTLRLVCVGVAFDNPIRVRMRVPTTYGRYVLGPIIYHEHASFESKILPTSSTIEKKYTHTSQYSEWNRPSRSCKMNGRKQ